jgi:hypothetical protein
VTDAGVTLPDKPPDDENELCDNSRMWLIREMGGDKRAEKMRRLGGMLGHAAVTYDRNSNQDGVVGSPQVQVSWPWPLW